MPSDISAEINTLIAGLQKSDPKVYQALTRIGLQLGLIDSELHPETKRTPFIASSTDALAPPSNFTIESTGLTVRFTWSLVTSASFYEIRRGTDWDTATFILKTSGSRADIDPLIYGSYAYLIKSITLTGIYSADFNQVYIEIPQISAVSISPEIIDNNVLLNWTEPTSVFDISYYILKRDGVEVGTMAGTFKTFFELVPGSYTYSIIAVDVAGNEGTESFTTVSVRTPPDFQLTDSQVSSLGGTRTNVLLESGPKLLCDWTSETYHAHFVGRGYATWQAKIDAGFPIYIQPAATTGSYEEKIDYGLIISNIIVSVTYSSNVITPSDLVTVVVKLAWSDDDITYTSFTSGAVQFSTHFRYLKVRLEFSGSNKALAEIFDLTTSITVKRDNDGGAVAALSTDVGGTEVTFNKEFKSVDSITVAVLSSTEPYKAIYIFTSVPNPTTFYVMVFDTTGARVSKTVSWKARGII